jgi:hypothetical protein
MRITWKDAITTISTAGAGVLAYAYFNDYSWSLVSNINWVIGGMLALGFITLVAGFAFDKFSNEYWDLVGVALAVGLGTVAVMGWSFEAGGYVTAMLVGVVTCWVVSLGHHIEERGTPRHFIHA